MNKVFIALMILLLTLVSYSQQIQEESVVINIEVPVRVFAEHRFVDTLTIGDFEVYENGKPQRIEAVYLVKKRSIERSEENRRFAPNTVRNFYLFFEIMEYTPKLGEAVEYFIHNVLYPGDNLAVVTPMKTYRLRSNALEFKSRAAIIDQLKGLLRKDALTGNSEYNNALEELTALANSLSALMSQRQEQLTRLDDITSFDVDISQGQSTVSVNEQLVRYEQVLEKLENLRHMDQAQLLNFAKFLKDQEGQRYVFIFYQREFLPQIDSRILDQYQSMYQNNPNIQQTLSRLFEFYRRGVSFDVDRVKQIYADSSISIHFLFITSPAQRVYGVTMQEQSEDVFSAFSEMARATGGFIDSSAVADTLFQKALDASENYYLVYYTPSDYKKDGGFREIEVKVKNKNLRVIHRAGYYAN